MTRCSACQRRRTLLFRRAPHTWACWRPACRTRIREFLRTV